MKCDFNLTVISLCFLTGMLGLNFSLPAYSQSQVNTEAWTITYRQIFRLSTLPDTTIGILNARDTASAYTYGIQSPSKQKERHYIGADGQDHVLLQAAAAGDPTGKCVFKRYDDRLLISREKAVDQYFIVQDTLGQIHWKIGNEQQIIGHYPTKKATGSFHGRNYTVWFTEAIKLPDGPWKLAGLPGLILKAQDDSGEVSFEAILVRRDAKFSASIIPPAGFPTILSYEAYRRKEQELEALDIAKGRSYFTTSGNGKTVSVSFKINKLEN